MKIYPEHLLFLTPGRFLAELEKDPAEKANFLAQREAAIAADTEGRRFQI